MKLRQSFDINKKSPECSGLRAKFLFGEVSFWILDIDGFPSGYWTVKVVIQQIIILNYQPLIYPYRT